MNFAWHRVQAILLRGFFFERRNAVRMTEFFYWPVYDITIWGMTSVWIGGLQNTTVPLVLLLMTGLVLQQVALRSSFEVSIALMEEMWSRSFVNLFASPLNMSEWIVAALISSMIKMFIVLLFGAGVVKLFFATNILAIGWPIILFAALLMMSGWILGFAAGSIIIVVGQRIGSMPWIMAYALTPFSGVFYPIESLPSWLQYVSLWLPTTYVFESMRQYIDLGTLAWDKLAMSATLNIVYLTFALGTFLFMLSKSRRRGLYRLE